MMNPQRIEDTTQGSLPQDWHCYMSPQGRRYYVNTITNETTWERPNGSPVNLKSPLVKKNSFPAVNGFHSSGSPIHQPESVQVIARKASSDPQRKDIAKMILVKVIIDLAAYAYMLGVTRGSGLKHNGCSDNWPWIILRQ
ncbi:growth arrest-specific protein 7-like [Bombina bombina]|uniref:growth arrest-specific protein 7-like n=1 Tax=Bombina bombina TaxID=8345 RepID=UPI00235AC4F1|nr:growth arrest-specific protein 7-like [Bombina bombina]